MIEKVLHPRNLTKSYYQVVRNKGSAGIDKMSVYELASYREAKGEALIRSLLNRRYVPQAIKGVKYQKETVKPVYWESPL